jgi:hypothetical protein
VDSAIYIDGKKMADRSPMQLDATAGRYRVSAHHEGCDDMGQVIDVASGGIVRVPFKLPVGETTRVELQSDPPGALIWMDGEPLMDGPTHARTPFSAGRVAPGRHALEMEGVPGMGTWHGHVQVSLGSSQAIRGVLPKADPVPEPAAASHRSRSAAKAPSPPPAAPAKPPEVHAARPDQPGTTFLDMKTGEVKQR